MKSLRYIPSLLTLLLGIYTASAETWVTDPNSCPEMFESQNCLFGEKLCGYNSGIVHCYDTSTITPPSAAGTSATQYATAFGGGYLINCEAYDGTDPHCTNNGNAWCNTDPSCSTKNRQTNCTAGAWGAFTCGTCKTGYTYCDGSYTDANGCEVQSGVTPFPGQANSIYTATGGCTAQCNAGYSDCNANPADGCEAQIGVTTCTTGAGAPGIYGAGCTCNVSTNFFETGVDTGYSTSDPLLWGTQFGTGTLANLGRNGGSDFVIDMDGTGNVTFQDGVTGPVTLADLASGGLTATPDRGILIDNNTIGLIDTCTDTQILRWNDTTSVWACSDETDSSLFIPYTGATTNIDLGDKNLTTTGTITATNLKITDWDTAFGWGDHSTAGYFKISDFACTDKQIIKWDSATSKWACAADDDTTAAETDPVFIAHVSFGIELTDITNWDTAFGWGDHSAAGYLTTFTELDPTVNKLGKTTLACTDGQVAKLDDAGTPADPADDTWVCADDTDTTLTDADITTLGYLKVETDPTVNLLAKATLACSAGQIVRYDGTTWGCGDDDRGQTLAITLVNDTNYTALATDYVIAYTNLTQQRVVTLPTSLCTDGRSFVIKDQSGDIADTTTVLAPLVIDPEAGGQIDGAATYTLQRNYNSINAYCKDGNWYIY